MNHLVGLRTNMNKNGMGNGYQVEQTKRSNTHMWGSIPVHGVVLIGGRITHRPLLMRFLDEQGATNQGTQGRVESFNDYLREYHNLGVEFEVVMSLGDFYQIKYMNKPQDFNGGPGNQNYVLQKTVGKLTFPMYDGSPKSTTRAYV